MVHLAGVHLFDETTGRYNEPWVQRHFPDRRMLLVNLVTWEQGLVVAPGNPLNIRTVADLLRPNIRFVSREAGAGAQKLLERLARAQGVPLGPGPATAPIATGHLEVAEAISLGAADAGIAIHSAALAFGLDFVPLAEERFDLVIPSELANDARVERAVDMLARRAFRRELDSLGGYLTDQTGHQVGSTEPFASAKVVASRGGGVDRR